MHILHKMLAAKQRVCLGIPRRPQLIMQLDSVLQLTCAFAVQADVVVAGVGTTSTIIFVRQVNGSSVSS